MITFIRRIENLEYMEAVKLLADRCGLELPMDSDQSDARSMLKSGCWKSTASRHGFSIPA